MGISVGILTVSDRCASGRRQDLGGPSLKAAVEALGWRASELRIVPDEIDAIRRTLLQWAGSGRIDLILTTGGTGISPRDVTPEATRAVLDKELPGFGELMRLRGLDATPKAALSRSLAGCKGRTLIINLPGSPKGAEESLAAVAELVLHALAILRGADHPETETPR